DAARLRDELQGHRHLRPDAAVRQQQPVTRGKTHAMTMPMFPFFRSAGCSLVAGALLLGGCASTPSQEPNDGVVYQRAAIMDVARPQANGGIYHASGDMRLFEDIKARQVGDILTIMLVESTSGSKSSDTSLSKSS